MALEERTCYTCDNKYFMCDSAQCLSGSPETIDCPWCVELGLVSHYDVSDYTILGVKQVFHEYETIDHPPHYNSNKYEAIDIIEDWELDFHLGNVVKYISRAGKKDENTELQDLKKALWYMNRKIKKLEKDNDEEN